MGTILSPQFILTAAHCIEEFDDLSDLSIQYGSTKIIQDASNIAFIQSIIPHENYDPILLVNDIAVLKLSKPIDMGEIENRVKLTIPNQFFPTGTSATLVGWGRNGTTGFTQEILQKSSLQIYSREDCNRIYGDGIFFANICAGGGGKGI